MIPPSVPTGKTGLGEGERRDVLLHSFEGHVRVARRSVKQSTELSTSFVANAKTLAGIVGCSLRNLTGSCRDPYDTHMILGLLTLLSYQLVGEIVVRFVQLPVPGPVLGMLLLFITLIWRGGAFRGLVETSSGLLAHLSLLFVPAGVGVVRYLSLLRNEGLALSAVLIVSTLLTLAVTGAAFYLVLKLTSKQQGT